MGYRTNLTAEVASSAAVGRGAYCSFAYSALASFRMGMSEVGVGAIEDFGLAVTKNDSGILSPPIAIR
jgi:hypothetical protein